MRRRRPRLRRIATILIAAAVPLFGASPALAHGELERSDPPNGGMVAEGRSSLSLWFTEPIRLEASTFTLYSLGEDAVTSSPGDGSGSVRSGVEVAITVVPSGTDGQGFVEIATDPLARAIYRLDFSVLSADDGHASSGSLLFGAGVRPAAPSASAGFPQPSNLLLRWVELSAVMLAIGAMAVSGRVLVSIGPVGGASLRRALWIGAVAACVAVVAGAISPFFKEAHAGLSVGAWFDATRATLTATAWGRLWVLREVALAIAAAALVSRAIRREPGRRRAAIAMIAIAAAVCVGAWAGHASGLPRSSGVAALASAIHLASAGVWAGGITVLAICLVPAMRRDPDARGPIISSAWRAFSPMAAVATVVLVASGLYEMGRYLPDLGSVTSSLYGRVVAGKVVLIAVALTIAGFNTLLVNPRLAAPVGRVLGRPIGWSPVSLNRFSTLVLAETVVLIIAVVGAALLTSVTTGREVALASRQTAPRSASVDGVFVTFEEVPTGPTTSRLIVRARSIVKPEPAPIGGVDVLLVDPDGTSRTVPLDAIEPGRYEAETDRLVPGTWQASVVVTRAGLPAAFARLGWDVVPEITEGVPPLEWATSGLAVLLLVALGATLTLIRRRVADPTLPMPADDAIARAPR